MTTCRWKVQDGVFLAIMLRKILSVSFIVVIGHVLCMNPDQADADFETDQDHQTMMLDGSAQSLAIATSNGIQCESISVPHCKRMIYNATTMPNFFDDLNQVDANARAQYYESLIESTCNPSISTYLCQLITPVCLDSDPETMHKFKIYPCRTFCRRMIRDCGQEIYGLNQILKNQLLPAFNCSRLPYEANGDGNSTSSSHGPCHDPFMDEQQQHEQQQQQQQPQQAQDKSNQYRPYSVHIDDPFIPDKSTLDLFPPFRAPATRISKQSQPATTNQSAPLQSQSQFQSPSQVPTIINTSSTDNAGNSPQGQPSWWQQANLFKQRAIANLVKYSNIISMITVMVLVFALHAKRMRRLGRFYSSSSASSASSSSGRSSAPLSGHTGPGCGGSLGRASFKSPRFGHDSVSAASASASATGTGAGGGGGYHTALARQQQIYSNILLSSPSHQILLLNDGSSQSGARSKLMPLAPGSPSITPKYSRAPPQTRAPLPPPLVAASNCYLSSDQQSTSGYYDELAPLSSCSGNYDAPLQLSNEPIRCSSFRRPLKNPSSSSSSTNKPANLTTIQCKQQQQNNMLFMGQ